MAQIEKTNTRVAILVKTKLKYDGRVLAEIDSLSTYYKSVGFRFFLLPDDDYEEIDFNKNVSVELINIFTRKLKFKKYLLPLTTLLYTLSCFWKLFRYRPDVIHIHDSFPLPVAFLYSIFRSPKLIYDDHELFKLNADRYHKCLYWFESVIMKRSQKVLVANEYRKRILNWIYKLGGDKVVVLENYNHNRKDSVNTFSDHELLDSFSERQSKGEMFLLHQGQVSDGRGLKYLIELAKALPQKARIVFMGISTQRYETLVQQNPVLKETSENIGFKPYEHINQYWSVMDGALIFYDTKEVNNRYCAPNRLYLGFSNRIPLLVNAENPVLNSQVKEHKAGLSLDVENAAAVLAHFFHLIESASFYPDTEASFSFEDKSAPVLKDIYEEILD